MCAIMASGTNYNRFSFDKHKYFVVNSTIENIILFAFVGSSYPLQNLSELKAIK